MKTKICFWLILNSLIQIGKTQTWNALGSGLNAPVLAMVVHENQIYAGGLFTNAGGNPEADYLARWDGVSWQAVAPGLDGAVEAILVRGSDIYVGGIFSDVGGIPNTRFIARWDGSSWNAVGGGLNNKVFAIALWANDLYVGGSFTNAGGNSNADHVARLDGSSWKELGYGILNKGTNLGVFSMAADENNLYVGGDFILAGGIPNTRSIARWDGTTWYALGEGFWGDMGAIALNIDGNNIYVGGDGSPSDTSSCGIARWDGEAWHGLDHGLSNCLYGEGAWAIATNNGNTYVGGIFTNAGGIDNTACLARWDGDNWHALGVPQLDPDPFNTDAVYTIATKENDVYVGGTFSEIGGVEGTMNIARWGETTVSNSEINSISHSNVLRVFPNPVLDVIHFDLGNDHAKIITLNLTDITGKLVIKQKNVDSEINIAHLPPGIYFLKAELKEEIYVTKINKQ